ncbi:MAG: hypothetical protein AB1656_23875 [Candidatus Omnitrophota bacterium]
MRFSELIQTPEITIAEVGPIYNILSSFNQVECVFNIDSAEEKKLKLTKTNPLGKEDTVYLSLKKHFEMEKDFFIAENVPYQELSQEAAAVGAKVGIMFISASVRLGGMCSILKRIEKPLSNKGQRLVGKDALFISFPDALLSINRRKRFRAYPRIEDHFCEITGYENNRHAPIPSYLVRSLSDIGASVIMMNVRSDDLPNADEEIFLRLNLFSAAKDYRLKRGVLVSVAEITEGKVNQSQFVFKCRAIHIVNKSERAVEIGLQFLEMAREGVSLDPKQFSHLTYLPIDRDKGIEPLLAWINKLQQLLRSQEKERGLMA